MTSPAIAAAAASTRTESQVREVRRATPDTLELAGEKFSVVWIGHLNPDYRRQPKTDHFCCLCQRDIKTSKSETGTIHYIDGGAAILALADESRYQAMNAMQPGGQEPGEMGCFPIGSECARKLPAGFVHHRASP